MSHKRLKEHRTGQLDSKKSGGPTFNTPSSTKVAGFLFNIVPGGVAESYCDFVSIPVGSLMAKIDSEDFEKIKLFKWWIHDVGMYGKYAISKTHKNRKHLLMHRYVLGLGSGSVVDHINHDKLDNRKANLRICTHGQNIAHGIKRTIKTSKYRGVHFDKSKNNWVAAVTSNGNVTRKSFRSEDDAVSWRNCIARKIHGEFASPC